MAKESKPLAVWELPATDVQFDRIEQLANAPEMTPDEKIRTLSWVRLARQHGGVTKERALNLIYKMSKIIGERRGPPTYPCSKCGKFHYAEPGNVCFWCKSGGADGDQDRTQ